jgi:hypothetical protein
MDDNLLHNGQTRTEETEEMEVEGADLLTCVRDLAKEGDVCRVILENPKGQVLLEVPLAKGLGVGGAVALLAPVGTALAAMGALLTKVKVRIIREVDEAR